MATPLKDLERDLARALEQGDADRVSQARRQIAEQHPDTAAAAEASFRLGMHTLFAELDLAAAAEHFRQASKVKGSPFASAARVSLGITLFRQGKHQQAVFELRKVAGQKPPTLAGAQALSFVAMIQRQVGPAAELERTRGELTKLLTQLTQGSKEESGLAHLMLAAEHKGDGRRAEAKRHLEAALAQGLEPSYADRARAMLLELT
jgi:tetratricopeptide (TPR) repeat protein